VFPRINGQSQIMGLTNIHQTVILIFLLCCTIGCQRCESVQLPAERYFDLIDKALARSRSQMPIISASAQEAAARLVAGGNLYAAKSQEAFRVEAIERAGGMMCLKWLTNGTPRKDDVVLIGIRGEFTADDCKAIQNWRARGAYVVVFASKSLPPEQKALPDALIDNCESPGLVVKVDGKQKLCPVDTVINVVNLWVWTGELTSACTRLGRMPILYQSYFIPGGRERAAKYRGKTFHDDMTIAPIPPGQLGNAYLDAISAALSSFRKNNMDRLTTVSTWWLSAGLPRNARLLTIGHLFPAHFQDPRAPQLITMQGSWKYQPLTDPPRTRHFVILCGYQNAPQKLVEQAAKDGFKLAYVSVKSTNPPEPADNIIYLRPYWPLTDGCVTPHGYDIPILPASGVVNAVVYWALLAQCCGTQN